MKTRIEEHLNKIQTDPSFLTKLELEAYSEMFIPETWVPMQLKRFYVWTDECIKAYDIMLDVRLISFQDFRNRIEDVVFLSKINGKLIGPACKSLEWIVNEFNNRHI